jgi:hypothetical protein
MTPIRFIVGALVLAAAQGAQAIQPVGAVAPSRSGPGEGDLVERGGTIDAVDAGKQMMVVDGTTYAIARGSARIHVTPSRVSSSISDLKRGMQIRFTSVKEHGQVHVREIWVTGAVAR